MENSTGIMEFNNGKTGSFNQKADDIIHKISGISSGISLLAFTCSKSTTETPEKCVKTV